jgi:cellulose synthase/poly-beta-1,6-N-acetylglucosamine synthase-like glycosyltransferase
MADALRSLRWQTAGCPVKTLLVSHGSQPDTNERLSILCEAEDATLLTIGNSAEPWTKPLALNTGLRAIPDDVPFVMTMDVDMILAPKFLAVVLDRLRRDSRVLVLSRISGLPAHAALPIGGDKLKRTSGMLHAGSHLRPCYGSGGIQAARAVRKPETSLQRFGGLAGKIFAKVESGSTIESFH